MSLRFQLDGAGEKKKPSWQKIDYTCSTLIEFWQNFPLFSSLLEMVEWMVTLSHSCVTLPHMRDLLTALTVCTEPARKEATLHIYIEFNYKINLHNRFAIKFEPTVSGFSFRRKKTLTAVSISADESALSGKLIIKQEKE